jgi:hypothetical protein
LDRPWDSLSITSQLARAPFAAGQLNYGGLTAACTGLRRSGRSHPISQKRTLVWRNKSDRIVQPSLPVAPGAKPGRYEIVSLLDEGGKHLTGERQKSGQGHALSQCVASVSGASPDPRVITTTSNEAGDVE